MYIRTSSLQGKAVTSREIQWQSGNLGQPARAENKFDTCTATQQNAIQAAFRNAQRAVNNAAAVLGTAVGKRRMAPSTQQLLNTHFHTVDLGDVREIFRNVFRISQALQNGLDFKCLAYCGGRGPPWCGFANRSQWFGGHGKIRICFDDRPSTCTFAKLDAQDQAATIIHEAAHRHVGIDDKVYVWEKPNPTDSSRDYRKLTPKDAMDNADSYAYFCVELYHGP